MSTSSSTIRMVGSRSDAEPRFRSVEGDMHRKPRAAVYVPAANAIARLLSQKGNTRAGVPDINGSPMTRRTPNATGMTQFVGLHACACAAANEQPRSGRPRGQRGLRNGAYSGNSNSLECMPTSRHALTLLRTIGDGGWVVAEHNRGEAGSATGGLH